MGFDSVKELKGEVFRRLTGVHWSTFEAMAALLFAAERKQKAAGGKPNTLCVEDQLLMMLEYWREYRTYFHLGQAYGRSRKCGLPQHQMVRKYAGAQQGFAAFAHLTGGSLPKASALPSQSSPDRGFFVRHCPSCGTVAFKRLPGLIS